MRLVLLLAALAVGSCQAGIPPLTTTPGRTDREFIKSLRDRTVMVTSYCDGKLAGSGSGVLLGGGWIVSANHVVPYGCVALVKGQLLMEMARDAEADLVLMRSPALKSPPIRWSDPYLGQEVICVGWSLQRFTNLVGEQVTRGVYVADYSKRFRASCSWNSGSSGGPIFDKQGRLVGIAVSFFPPFNDEYLATPAKAVEDLLNATITASAKSSPRLGR